MAYHYDFTGIEGGIDVVCDSCGAYLGWVGNLEDMDKGILLCNSCTIEGCSDTRLREVGTVEALAELERRNGSMNTADKFNEIKDAVILARGTGWWSWEELENFIAVKAKELGEEYPNRVAEQLVKALYY